MTELKEIQNLSQSCKYFQQCDKKYVHNDNVLKEPVLFYVELGVIHGTRFEVVLLLNNSLNFIIVGTDSKPVQLDDVFNEFSSDNFSCYCCQTKDVPDTGVQRRSTINLTRTVKTKLQ